MKDGRTAVAKYFQLQLPADDTKRKGYTGKSSKLSTTSSKITQSPSGIGATRSQSSHDCVAIDCDSTSLLAQHILVGSALRRPHASQFSPLDYQSMPDVGRSPRQPYKSQTSCTVFAYAARPVSAKSEPAHLGRHTKSSLLRCKSASAICSSSSSISSCDENHTKTQCNKKLCKIREDYRFFNNGPFPKQSPPDGESMHAFLTGARYNRTRFLDSKSLSTLGVYIPKAGLNTFFVREEKAGLWANEDDNASNSSESSPESIFSEQEQLESDAQHTKNKAVNTEPHFLSISRWQPAEWKTDRKNTKEARVTSAPIRIKPIKAYYYDYDNTKRKRPSTSVRKGNSRL